MLAIVELLSGIRSGEDEFLRRRSAMRNMSEAHVSIDWRPPEFLMVGAFERTRSVVDNARRIDDMPKKLLAMSKRAVDSNSLKDFKSRLNLANAESVLEEIGAYDERVSKTFVTNTVKGDAYTKKVAEEIRSGVRPAPPLGKTWSLKKFSEHLARDTGLNRSIPFTR